MIRRMNPTAASLPSSTRAPATRWATPRYGHGHRDDNDDAPSPDTPVASISADATTITEGEDATFTVALDRAAPAGGLTISVDVTESGSYIADSTPTEVFIASGAMTGALTISTEDDSLDETDGAITVRITTTGTGYAVGTPNTARVTVDDDDTLLASITAADPTTITEGTDATFTVTLDREAPAGGLTINVRVTESGSYIDGLAPTEVVIAEGATTGTLTVSTEDDSLDEPDGSITATINAGAGYTVADAPDNAAAVTVNDDDVLLASITAADPTTIIEGTDATFTVTLGSAAPAGGLTVRVNVIESGSYIAGSAPTTVNIAEGATTGMLIVLTVNDAADEPDGSITAELNAGTGYTVGTLSTARVTVSDNDDPVVSITADPTPITEGAAATFTVALGNAAPAGGITVSVRVTESGSYIVGSAPATATVFIAGGDTTGTLMVSTEDDTTDEPDGSITAELNAGASYTLGTPNTATVTVNDNDVLLASISVDPTTITEGEVATFTVTLGSAAPAGGITINVDVTESGSYIAATAPMTVVIASGATTVTLAVSTEGDNLDEPDGSITAALDAGVGYTVGTPNTAIVTVNDDDVLLASITAGPSPITEGAPATFTVTLANAAPAGGLTINVGVTDSGSYIDGSAPATVVIAAGATTRHADRPNRE